MAHNPDISDQHPGYHYYHSEPDAEPSRRAHLREARQMGEERLNPSLGDVDYLSCRRRREILERWFHALPAGLRVLDVGGRIQPYRSLLSSRLELYVAIDLILEGLLDVLARAEALPFGTGLFDVVLCCQVLNYVPRPDLAIAEIYRVLRPGGRLFLTVPGLYPNYHDQLWRFMPDGLRSLTRQFSSVEIQAEGGSAAGLVRAINVTLHAGLQRYRLRRLAQLTSIPTLNLLGAGLDRVSAADTRSASNYCVMAIK